MENMIEFLNAIIKERPVGSKGNEQVLNILQEEAVQMGYAIVSLPFECQRWETEKSFIEIDNESLEIFASPFSRPFNDFGQVVLVSSIEELQMLDVSNKILILKGSTTQQPLQPKNFPFYYPDEHKHMIDLLEEKSPKAIIAVTGKHPMCGLMPFPLFEDGNFSIPSAYIDELIGNRIVGKDNIHLCINSKIMAEKSRQIIASSKAKVKGKGKIIVCAHMDTKYRTSGAIDNAVGVCVMLKVMQNLKECNSDYDIDFLPFNGEEYYEVKGQLEYLNYMQDKQENVKLVINIDSPCHKDSKTAVSTYNFNEELSAKLNSFMANNEKVVMGKEWFAGDHAMFAFNGTPCIAVTSSNLFETVLEITHTRKDTIDQLSFELITQTADFLATLINLIQI